MVLQDQGTVKNDEGTVQYDTVEVACHITAPIDGRVGLAWLTPETWSCQFEHSPSGCHAGAAITVIFTLAENP